MDQFLDSWHSYRFRYCSVNNLGSGIDKQEAVSSAASGMHTLNMDLSRLMQQGYITREEAMKFTNNKAELIQYM